MQKDNSEKPTIKMPGLCEKHKYLLVHQAGYAKSDPWMALLVVAEIALFQAVTCDDEAQKKLGGDITRLPELGCLACYKPDTFGEIVELAKTKDLGKIKTYGENCIANAKK